jgi:hypothetical protein
VVQLDLGSRETEQLIKALRKYRDGPDTLSHLVQALREEEYCNSLPTAYRYAHRILEIRKIFTSRTPENHNPVNHPNPTKNQSQEEASSQVFAEEMPRKVKTYLDDLSRTADGSPAFPCPECRCRTCVHLKDCF